jgi:D-alanine-D-alanine ligase
MKGFSRSEFIIVNSEPFMLEMNTVPGLTTESLLPQQAKAAGIELSELFENAIESAYNEFKN